MTFLPIVDRELRVAARRRSTYRIRTWTAVIALVVGFFSLFPALLGARYGSLGKSLYTTLTDGAFGLCLLAGVLLTADCLSEEKREGTLGFLFLTDLRGYDVVLGKFMAMSLNAFFGLLAILPMTGLCLLLGGLTGGEFWRTNLALLNTLFFSLATGICVSAFGRSAQRVMGGTLGAVILLAAGAPLTVWLGHALHVPLNLECCAWISPYRPFAKALEPMYLWQPGQYWWALAASHLLGWLLLVIASFALPHHWQERAAAGDGANLLRRWAQPARREAAARARTREKLLPVNPVLWLMSGGLGFRRIAWVIVGAWGAVVLLTLLFTPVQGATFTLSMYAVRPFGFLLKCLLALQACRFFVEARRNGALEMLLCTPLTSREIVNGQVRALRRSFQWPVIALVMLLFVPAVAQFFPPFFAGRAWAVSDLATAFFGALVAAICGLRMVADCYAVGVFGIWLALTVKKPGLAPGLTILFVLILPSVLCVLDVFADLFFILWGVIKLRQTDLRSLAVREYQPVTATPGLPHVNAR